MFVVTFLALAGGLLIGAAVGWRAGYATSGAAVRRWDDLWQRTRFRGAIPGPLGRRADADNE